MAYVIGPNGLVTEVPEDVARALIGDGDRGYASASEPAESKPAKRTPAKRRTTTK